MAWWSKSQATVALGSGEAEYNACAAGLAEQVALLFLRQEACAAAGWGREGLSMGTDSVAAQGILNRVGSRAVKHMSVTQMRGHWCDNTRCESTILPVSDVLASTAS